MANDRTNTGYIQKTPDPFNNVYVTDRPIQSMFTKSPEKFDPVNKAKHYNCHPSGIECIVVAEHMGFNIGNAIKYLWRAGMKGSTIEDLRKAVWYINREIERLSKNAES